MTILILFAFLSGLVTILAPCIWPLLPIILSSSIAGKNHKRPLGITLGILISFGIFTLTVSYLVNIFNFNPEVLRLFAVLIIGFLGLTLVVPQLTRLVEGAVSRLTSILGTRGRLGGDGFIPGLITGISLGIVWTPCAGPILAAIAALAATQQVTWQIVLITIVYLVGVGIPLFLFAYAGQRFVLRTRFVSKYTGLIQRMFGVIMILTAVAIFTNYDKVVQAKTLDYFPALTSFLTNFENNDLVKDELDRLQGREIDTKTNTNELFNVNYKAPNFIGINNWINTKPLTLEELKGKVVLVDFWTYTCINCIRTFPYVTSWYEKYKDDGFVVVGIHTPEFEFEKDTRNVINATKQYGINYPVGQDNNFATWNNYKNRYWPAHYLIDANGVVRRVHFGEGEYKETEEAIQKLLKEKGTKADMPLEDLEDQTPKTRVSPETYLGSRRMEYLYPNGFTKNGVQNFTAAKNNPVGTFTFRGTWDVQDEYSKAVKNAVIDVNFFAKNVFLVLKPDSNPGIVKVFLNEKLVNTIIVDSDKLYEILRLPEYGEHKLKLEFSDGVEAFAFTFG